MKKKIFIGLLFASLGLTSCDKDLDVLPRSSITTEIAYQTQNDFSAATKGSYRRMLGLGLYGASSGPASIYFIPDVVSDNVIINSLGRRSRETFYDWRYTANATASTTFLSGYQVVQNSNIILANIDNLADGDFKNNIKGEALFARGFAHFDLVKLFGKSYISASDSDLGVSFVTSIDASAIPSRNTLKDTYSLIVNDLTESYSLINEDNGVGRANKAVVAALLSRVYLYMGEWQKAVDNAVIVENTGASLASVENFSKIWTNETNDGVVFQLTITNPDGISIGTAWNQSTSSGQIRSEYNCDTDFFNSYSDTDIRKSSYFNTSEFDGVVFNHIVKYKQRPGSNANVVNALPIRYAEVILNRAEAYYNLGGVANEEKALADLNALRANRYSDYVAGNETGMDLLNAIKSERRKELAFEGHRFFDLKRWGEGVNRSDKGDRADGTGVKHEFTTLPAGDSRFEFPIPQTEMNSNPNMIQNPGY